MREFFRLEGVNCVGEFFDLDSMPSRIIVLHHIESVWGEAVTDFLSQSNYDYIISEATIAPYEVRRWTIPSKVKMFKRQQKLKELGI